MLIVDDCAANRALLAAILTHKKIPFEQAENGIEAISKFDSQDFSLVLMDVQMPLMDGFAAASQIRKKWPDRHVAIVAVTASIGDLRGDVYHQAGFTDKIHKPFPFSDIDHLLSKYAATV